METASQTERKKPRKYCIVQRATQAEVIHNSNSLSQRGLAEKYGIPRTTLQHWAARKKELEGKKDPFVAAFFESPSGQGWLHQMVLATFLVFHKNGTSGTPDLHEFFEMIDINAFVGTSISCLQNVSKKIDQQLIIFGEEETERLSQNMSHKNIPGAVDENFIMNEMTLILMDPISGYILAEQLEEKRDADTWNKVTQAALKGLNVTIQQLVGDEAGGLTKLATTSLRVIKGSDLFHIQQEITEGLTGPLARAMQQAKKRQEDLQKEKLEAFSKFAGEVKRIGGIEELSKRGINVGNRILEIEKEEKTNQKKLETAEKHCKIAREARRNITSAYHPFNLDSGEKQTPEAVKIRLEESYRTLEDMAREASCTEKQMNKLEKSRGLIGSMIEVLVFFFSFLKGMVQSMGLDETAGKLFEELVALEYLRICLPKSKKKEDKEKIRISIQKIEKEIESHLIWEQISQATKTVWRRKALDCAQIFQRSSSCVEGRNGQLSLKFHAFRRLNGRTLKVLTILHNFFIKRADGTTSGERFFGQKPQDLFMWLLDKVELPRPRKKHTRRKKITREKQAA
jgi:hypothetical protein